MTPLDRLEAKSRGSWPVRSERHAIRDGFTILELLIAVVILVIGILGILALFPTAMRAAQDTVEDSYAGEIARSVADALSVGLRENSFTLSDTRPTARPWTYFIFEHDGVHDAMVPTPQVYANAWDKDWCILLPQGEGSSPGPNEPFFMYPSCPDRAFDGIGAGGGADRLPGPPDQRTVESLSVPEKLAALDDWSLSTFFKTAADDSRRLWVRRVFTLGRYRAGTNPAGVAPGSVRAEFLNQNTDGSSSPDRIALDPYPQYSFAISIRRVNGEPNGPPAKTSPAGNSGGGPGPSMTLYEERVLVFRNFDGSKATQDRIAGGTPIPRGNLPVHEFMTLFAR